MTKADRGRFLFGLVLALSGCAPQAVPRDASRHWSLKDGNYWTWKQPAGVGCLSWLAVENWASVTLFADKSCETVPEIGSGAKGLSYFSIEDKLVFKGYWPWSPEIYDRLVVYDERGMFVRTLPCPNSLPKAAIAEMKAVAVAGAATASTDAEKRIIKRIMERLTRTESDALSAQQDGCSDWREGQDSDRKADPWNPT